MECQSMELKLSKQRIRIGNQHESVPSRPFVPGMIGDWKRIWRDLFKKNPHIITTHFEISFLEIPWKLMYNLHHNLIDIITI